jgi:hypothetical protein
VECGLPTIEPVRTQRAGGLTANRLVPNSPPASVQRLLCNGSVNRWCSTPFPSFGRNPSSVARDDHKSFDSARLQWPWSVGSGCGEIPRSTSTTRCCEDFTRADSQHSFRSGLQGENLVGDRFEMFGPLVGGVRFAGGDDDELASPYADEPADQVA